MTGLATGEHLEGREGCMCMEYYDLDVYTYPTEISDLIFLVHINISFLHTVQSSPPQICSETFEC